jgi:hypothetical protein
VGLTAKKVDVVVKEGFVCYFLALIHDVRNAEGEEDIVTCKGLQRLH